MASDIKAQVARAKREDKIATGILMAIVAFIFVLLAALIVYIIASGAQKAFDPSFLTGKPEKAAASAPSSSTRSTCSS